MDKAVVLCLDNVEIVMLILSLAVAMLAFASRRTNVLQGAVHIVLFLAYVILIFD